MNIPPAGGVGDNRTRMKILPLLSGLILLSVSARADEKTQNAQTELKSEGFFYGEVDGNLTPETSSAIKRYQIRNGLEVTGTLTQQTLEALGLGGTKAPPATTAPIPRAPLEKSEVPPPTTLRQPETIEESDRQFLRKDDPSTRPENPPVAPPPPPGPAAPAGEDYAALFARTPFATAPAQVQQSTLRKAQSYLAGEGVYRERIDGLPSSELEEALLTYQRRARLPLTGRLDLETLSKMHLLPGRGGPPLQPFYGRERVPAKTYRGVWVD
jgi:peptidoglycan hydrolase-like protein with peptidoglycan-binding domain